MKVTASSAALLRACCTPSFVTELHSAYETSRDVARAFPSLVDTMSLSPDALLLLEEREKNHEAFILAINWQLIIELSKIMNLKHHACLIVKFGRKTLELWKLVPIMLKSLTLRPLACKEANMGGAKLWEVREPWCDSEVKQRNEKVSLLWDNFSSFTSCRTKGGLFSPLLQNYIFLMYSLLCSHCPGSSCLSLSSNNGCLNPNHIPLHVNLANDGFTYIFLSCSKILWLHQPKVVSYHVPSICDVAFWTGHIPDIKIKQSFTQMKHVRFENIMDTQNYKFMYYKDIQVLGLNRSCSV